MILDTETKFGTMVAFRIVYDDDDIEEFVSLPQLLTHYKAYGYETKEDMFTKIGEFYNLPHNRQRLGNENPKAANAKDRETVLEFIEFADNKLKQDLPSQPVQESAHSFSKTCIDADQDSYESSYEEDSYEDSDEEYKECGEGRQIRQKTSKTFKMLETSDQVEGLRVLLERNGIHLQQADMKAIITHAVSNNPQVDAAIRSILKTHDAHEHTLRHRHQKHVETLNKVGKMTIHQQESAAKALMELNRYEALVSELKSVNKSVRDQFQRSGLHLTQKFAQTLKSDPEYLESKLSVGFPFGPAAKPKQVSKFDALAKALMLKIPKRDQNIYYVQYNKLSIKVKEDMKKVSYNSGKLAQADEESVAELQRGVKDLEQSRQMLAEHVDAKTATLNSQYAALQQEFAIVASKCDQADHKPLQSHPRSFKERIQYKEHTPSAPGPETTLEAKETAIKLERKLADIEAQLLSLGSAELMPTQIKDAVESALKAATLSDPQVRNVALKLEALSDDRGKRLRQIYDSAVYNLELAEQQALKGQDFEQLKSHWAALTTPSAFIADLEPLVGLDWYCVHSSTEPYKGRILVHTELQQAISDGRTTFTRDELTAWKLLTKEGKSIIDKCAAIVFSRPCIHGRMLYSAYSPSIIHTSCGAYDVLNVARDASTSDITAQYRRLSTRMHPDKWDKICSSETRFATRAQALLNDANSVLQDDTARREFNKEMPAVGSVTTLRQQCCTSLNDAENNRLRTYSNLLQIFIKSAWTNDEQVCALDRPFRKSLKRCELKTACFRLLVLLDAYWEVKAVNFVPLPQLLNARGESADNPSEIAKLECTVFNMSLILPISLTTLILPGGTKAFCFPRLATMTYKMAHERLNGIFDELMCIFIDNVLSDPSRIPPPEVTTARDRVAKMTAKSPKSKVDIDVLQDDVSKKLKKWLVPQARKNSPFLRTFQEWATQARELTQKGAVNNPLKVQQMQKFEDRFMLTHKGATSSST